jgi:hypothetical protein
MLEVGAPIGRPCSEVLSRSILVLIRFISRVAVEKIKLILSTEKHEDFITAVTRTCTFRASRKECYAFRKFTYYIGLL